MKKLLFILILFLSKLSYGQFPNGFTQGNAQTLWQNNGGFKALLGFIPPTLDTLNNPASTYYGALTTSPLYPGKLFMSIQTKWVEVSGSTNISFPGTTGKYLTGYNNVFGMLNTDSVTEATNLYFLPSRARLSLSALSPLVYNNATGVFSADTSILSTKANVITQINAIPVKWNVLGNSAITSANWIGTINNASLRFRTNNVERMVLDSFGNFSVSATGNPSVTAIPTAFQLKGSDGYAYFNVNGGFQRSELSFGPNNPGFGKAGFITAYDDTIYTNNFAGLTINSSGGIKINTTFGGTSTLAGNYDFMVVQSGSPQFTVKEAAKASVIVGSDTTYIPSAALVVTSATKGVIFPRRSGFPSAPATGLMYFNNDSAAYLFYNGSSWVKFGTSASSGPPGSVNSVGTGYGLSGGPITSTGTLLWDSAIAYITSVRRKDSTITFATPTQLALKQNSITLTTTGTSGASTLVGATLNIPQYAGGSPNVWVGAGFRLTFPGTNNVRTLFNGFATLIDSTSNTNGLTFKSDSTLMATRLRVAQAITDSLYANIDTISHAAQAVNYDSLFVIHPSNHRITFVKLTGGISPIVLTQASDTSIGFSMPSFVPASGKILTLNNSLTLAGTDGTVMTFPTTSATVARTDATAQTFSGDVTLSGINIAGNMRSGSSTSNSNFVYSSAGNSTSVQTDSKSLPDGIPGLNYRVNFTGGTAGNMTDLYGYANVNIANVSVGSVSGGTGAAPFATNLLVRVPTYINNGQRVHLLSAVEITGKPSFTNADSSFSLFVRGTTYNTDTIWGKTMGTNQNDSTIATTRFVHAAIAQGGSLVAASNIVESNVQLINTATTTENTVYTGTIPAHSMGINGHWDILGLASYPTNANNKIFKIKINGTTVLSRTNTTSVADRWYFSIFNRNSLAAQIAPGGAGGQVVGGGTSNTTLGTYFFDTSVDLPIVVTIQNASAGDGTTTALESLTVVAYP